MFTKSFRSLYHESGPGNHKMGVILMKKTPKGTKQTRKGTKRTRFPKKQKTDKRARAAHCI